ncbi:MAG TPA: hypothetical protein PLP30_11805 [Clostridia bacterium]|nr:hypothetical protein [Clostridia bacterium]HPQ48047.1 hypothetical protein [Clostridia bacterium]
MHCKKSVPQLFILLMIVLIIFTSCNTNDTFAPVLSLDEKGVYTGFRNAPESVTLESAESLGYIVIDGQRVAENKDVWDKFVDDSSRKKDASARLVYFLNNKSVYLVDIFYSGGRYFIFDSSAEEPKSSGFDYLLTLEGSFGMPARETRLHILADDSSITFDKYMTAMFSSNTEVIQSVQPSRMIMMLLLD